MLHKYDRVMSANEAHCIIAGLQSHEMKPSVVRPAYFIKERKQIRIVGEDITKGKIEKQVRQHQFYKWFERNQFENELYKKIDFTKEYSNIETLKQYIQEIHLELGYDILDIDKMSDVKKYKIKYLSDFTKKEHLEV